MGVPIKEYHTRSGMTEWGAEFNIAELCMVLIDLFVAKNRKTGSHCSSMFHSPFVAYGLRQYSEHNKVFFEFLGRLIRSARVA